MKHVERYLEDLAIEPPDWVTLPAPASRLQCCVVIPAYDERVTIGPVLDALAQNRTPPDGYEVLVVVNNAVDTPTAIRRENERTIAQLHSRDDDFPLHVIDRATDGRAFPADASGVGHARRLAMDLATRRLAEAGTGGEGIIACLDGDSPPAEGYVDEVLAAFRDADSTLLAGVCRYRHPIPKDPEHARAIVDYENWMRYFEIGMHLAGTRYAYQAIGSCMVIRAGGYALADGVPTREALSDFYLLQKIAKVGGDGAVLPLEKPLVHPSARPSGRVPRGTGPSVRQSMTRSEWTRFEMVEPPRAFRELSELFDNLSAGFEDLQGLRERTPEHVDTFMDRWNGWETFEKLREHAPTAAHFADHVQQWFDGLKVVKYANRRSREAGRTWIFDAVRRLMASHDRPELAEAVPETSAEHATLQERLELLELLRDHELDFHEQTA